jgi:lysozyme family protein
MGGEYLPKALIELRKEYRKLFKKNQLESKKAKEIKDEILNFESENSSFFQDIKFENSLK